MGMTVAVTRRRFSVSFRRVSVVVPASTAIFLPPMSATRLTGESDFTRKPPPSTKIRFEKSTEASRASVCVVFAHSMSALPDATICRRSDTDPPTQFTLRFGSPTARPICAITRLQMSIEYPAGSLLGPTNENGSESPENATLIAFAALILPSVLGAGWAVAVPATIVAATNNAKSRFFTCEYLEDGRKVGAGSRRAETKSAAATSPSLGRRPLILHHSARREARAWPRAPRGAAPVHAC